MTGSQPGNTGLIPAIDLLDGSCVRLLHGNFHDCKVYDLDVHRLAAEYAEAGAEWLHVVDLAASRDGDDADIRPLLRLLQRAPQRVQTGGGVRDEDDIRIRLEQGADRVVVGSVSIAQPERFAAWLEMFGADRLVAALDVRIGEDGVPRPRTHGWTRGSERDLWQLLDFHTGQGLRHLLCTDIGRDGAMAGPNVDLYRQITDRYPSLSVQASGGVSGLRDLRSLAATGVDSIITGKALLEGCFTVAEALEALE
ncbi:MAG: 1-(5-phosphoribosyl)-5-[(5-phosphoribosylamino)methylideneamino] imidazole-4-carboxamide isomerase [Lysobacterales bacterium]|jgi:phosphoribosylformimino-5-aminoimidazole carboxamide ribotide isomerase